MPNILIAHEDGDNLRITGMVDVADDLKELVGTSTDAPDIVLEKSAGANLEQALVDGLRSAREVLGGYVKFAKPILVKGVVPPYVTEKLAQVTHKPSVPNINPAVTEKRAAQLQVDEEFVNGVKAMLQQVGDGAFEKSAKVNTSAFTKRLFAQMEADKVDGTAIGLNVPCKIAFDSPGRRDWFLGLFDGLEGAEKKARSFSIDDIARQMVDDGLVKGGVAEKLASAGVRKHAQLSTTRRK